MGKIKNKLKDKKFLETLFSVFLFFISIVFFAQTLRAQFMRQTGPYGYGYGYGDGYGQEQDDEEHAQPSDTESDPAPQMKARVPRRAA